METKNEIKMWSDLKRPADTEAYCRGVYESGKPITITYKTSSRSFILRKVTKGDLSGEFQRASLTHFKNQSVRIPKVLNVLLGGTKVVIQDRNGRIGTKGEDILVLENVCG